MSLSYIKSYRPPVGNPTSMVSLVLPSGSNIDTITKRLNTELATSSNIKDRSNRQSVAVALKQIIEFLKSMKHLPPTGIALFAESSI